ncbi:MAG: hypothetical protein P8Z80_05850 [Pseudolabrys sp.]
MVLAPLLAYSAAALTGLALLSSPTFAESTQGTAGERSACMGDAFRFCGPDIPNVPKIEACLIQNMGKLSVGCREEFHRAPEGRTILKRAHFK